MDQYTEQARTTEQTLRYYMRCAERKIGKQRIENTNKKH